MIRSCVDFPGEKRCLDLGGRVGGWDWDWLGGRLCGDETGRRERGNLMDRMHTME